MGFHGLLKLKKFTIINKISDLKCFFDNLHWQGVQKNIKNFIEFKKLKDQYYLNGENETIENINFSSLGPYYMFLY